jgi:hypothetical protein
LQSADALARERAREREGMEEEEEEEEAADGSGEWDGLSAEERAARRYSVYLLY